MIRQSPFTPSGLPKPVRNYEIIASIDDLVEQDPTFHEEQDGLKVLVDVQKLDKLKPWQR